MASEVTTRILGQEDYPRWAAMVAQSSDGSAYCRPDYLEVLAVATGGCFRILAAERDGTLVGGVALFEQPGSMGTVIAPRLLLYYNGIVLAPHASKYPSHQTTWHLQTLTALEQALSQLPHARLRLKSRSNFRDARVFRERGWSVQPTYSYVVDIRDLEAAWERIDKNQRRLIGRCQSQGLQLAMDTDFAAFHCLHMQTHERKGAPLYLPHDTFVDYFTALQARGLCHLYHARLPDGRVIASQLVLTGSHCVTHTVCAGADAEFLSLGAPAFLRWKAFEHLAANGYTHNDLTDTALNPVTHFKSQLGGELAISSEVWRPDRPGLRLHNHAMTLAAGAKRRLRRLLTSPNADRAQGARHQ